MVGKALKLVGPAALALSLGLQAFGGPAQPETGTSENPYPIPKTDARLKVDGVLDEPAWAAARVLELNGRTSPRRSARRS